MKVCQVVGIGLSRIPCLAGEAHQYFHENCVWIRNLHNYFYGAFNKNISSRGKPVVLSSCKPPHLFPQGGAQLGRGLARVGWAGRIWDVPFQYTQHRAMNDGPWHCSLQACILQKQEEKKSQESENREGKERRIKGREGMCRDSLELEHTHMTTRSLWSSVLSSKEKQKSQRLDRVTLQTVFVTVTSLS